MATDPTPQNGATTADGPAPHAAQAPPAPSAPPAPPAPSAAEEALYTAQVRNRGNTAGEVVIEGAGAVELAATAAGPDGAITLPTGGPSAEAAGFDPEQLLAASWSTCLGETLKMVLREHGHRVASRVSVEVDLLRDPAGGYRFAPRAEIGIDELPAEEAQALIEAAHDRCPVSKLLAGGGDVSVTRVP